MLRQSLIQTLKPGLRSTLYPASRTITTTAVRMGEGDTGATRSGGAAQGYVATPSEHLLMSIPYWS